MVLIVENKEVQNGVCNFLRGRSRGEASVTLKTPRREWESYCRFQQLMPCPLRTVPGGTQVYARQPWASTEVVRIRRALDEQFCKITTSNQLGKIKFPGRSETGSSTQQPLKLASDWMLYHVKYMCGYFAVDAVNLDLSCDLFPTFS